MQEPESDPFAFAFGGLTVVALLASMAAIAVPAWQKFETRTRTAEGIINLRKLFDASVAYYEAGATDLFGRPIEPRFPGTDRSVMAPAENHCCVGENRKCAPNPAAWVDPVWRSLNFAVDEPHRYWYSFTSVGTGEAARFTAGAHGNLDCAGPYSTFERVGGVVDGKVVGGAGIFSIRPLE